LRLGLLSLAIVVISILGSGYYWQSLLASQADQRSSTRHRNEQRADQLSIAVDQQFDAVLRGVDTALNRTLT